MIGKLAFLISLGGITTFIVTALSNVIMEGVYGLKESKYKLMISFSISAIFFGLYLVINTPGA